MNEDMLKARARAYIAAAPWRFARTMPEIPHWYTVRGQTPDDRFEWFVALVREEGYGAEFGGRRYTYLDIDGHSYWTMGSPIAATTIINRRELP